jgi:hypothetical protein
MLSFTGLKTNTNSDEDEEFTTWKLCSHSIEVMGRSEEQVREALSPTRKMLLR